MSPKKDQATTFSDCHLNSFCRVLSKISTYFQKYKNYSKSNLILLFRNCWLFVGRKWPVDLVSFSFALCFFSVLVMILISVIFVFAIIVAEKETLSSHNQEGQDVLLFIDNIFRFTQAGTTLRITIQIMMTIRD